MKVELAKLSDIPDEGVSEIEFFGRPALVLNANGRPIALMNTCAHLGGPLEWRDGALCCGWHGACFTAAGERISGPGGDRIMKLPTIVEDGALKYVWGASDQVGEVECPGVGRQP